MLTLILFLICIFTAAGFMIWGAYSDFKGLRIPNAASIGVIVTFILCYPIATFLVPEEVKILGLLYSHLASFGIVAVLTLLLYAPGMIGGGDTKLCSAIALWMPLSSLGAFIFSMTLVGGLLGLVTLGIAKAKPFKTVPPGGWIDQVQSGRNAVPYGIAIAIGGLLSFWEAGYMSPALWQNIIANAPL